MSFKIKRVYVKENSTGKILIEFIPTRAGVNQAKRYKGLADLQAIIEYTNGEVSTLWK